MKSYVMCLLPFAFLSFNELFSNLLYPAASSNATICIAYPKSKEDRTIYLFLNTKKMKPIHYGERIQYHLSTDQPVKITISGEDTYQEPSTLSKTTRTITPKPGKEYFFEINGKGELEYIINSEKGKQQFDTNGNFTGEPTSYTLALNELQTNQ